MCSGLIIITIVITDSCHVLSGVYMLHVLSPMYAFSSYSRFLELRAFAGEAETLIEVTQSVSEEARTPSQVIPTPEPLLKPQHHTLSEF